jgi:hypothetical protein
MKLQLSPLILALLCCISAPSNAATPCVTAESIVKHDGTCWNSLSEIVKYQIINGMWAGIDAAAVGQSLGGNNETNFLFLNHLRIPKETGTYDIGSYFDKLYASPANREIDWSYAYILAALAARDDDENDRLTLISFLREHHRVPTSGTIVGIKDKETVLISSDNEVFDVRLAGIEVPAAIADTTSAVLNAMSKGGYSFLSPCASPQPLYVDLAYLDELFDEAGRLVSYVRISSSQVACVGAEVVSLSPESARWTDISRFLVQSGLAVIKKPTDKLWSKERRNAREFMQSDEDRAVGLKLYVHGAATIKTVEQLLGHGSSPPL